MSTVAVIGAGRGLGRGAAEAFAKAGATVLALARTESELLELEAPVVAMPRDALDATDRAGCCGDQGVCAARWDQ